MALSNGLPKEDIRALLLSEMQRRVETRKTRWTALDGPQRKFVNSEHPHLGVSTVVQIRWERPIFAPRLSIPNLLARRHTDLT